MVCGLSMLLNGKRTDGIVGGICYICVIKYMHPFVNTLQLVIC